MSDDRPDRSAVLPTAAKRQREPPVFYWLYTVLIVAGAGMVLVPNFPYIKVILFSQVLNGIVLPFVLVFMVLLNKRELMGDHVVAWATMIRADLAYVGVVLHDAINASPPTGMNVSAAWVPKCPRMKKKKLTSGLTPAGPL